MRQNKKISARDIALLGLLTAAALILSYVEAILPLGFGIPGVKLGLANLVIVAALYTLSEGKAFIINIIRKGEENAEKIFCRRECDRDS